MQFREWTIRQYLAKRLTDDDDFPAAIAAIAAAHTFAGWAKHEEDDDRGLSPACLCISLVCWRSAPWMALCMALHSQHEIIAIPV